MISIVSRMFLMLVLLVPSMAISAEPNRDLSPQALAPYWFEAMRAGDTALVEELLRRGIDIEATNERGFTALILATYNEQPELVRRLLAHGADPNRGDRAGNTALMGALFRGNEASAHLLLADPRIEIDRRNSAGQTAAMFAALFGRTALLLTLADRGADLDAVDTSGASVRSLAARQGHEALLAELEKRD